LVPFLLLPALSDQTSLMRDYFIRRLLLIPPTLLGITLIVFMITRAVPGGPLQQALMEIEQMSMSSRGGGRVTQDRALSETQINQLKAYYGLDEPWHIAYVKWLAKVCRGDFGRSFRYGEPVIDLVMQRMPVSLFYGTLTLVITYAVCVPLGILKAIRHRTTLDSITSLLIFVGYAVPGYVLGALLVVFFAAKLEWFPMGGFTSMRFDDLSTFEKVVDLLHHAVLPVTCYLVGSFAFLTLLMKNNLMDNLAADYIRTAMAKGTTFRRAVVGHALRNSFIPIATNLGQSIVLLVTGSFLIEMIFDIDGLGYLGIKSVLDYDYQVVMGVLVLTSVVTLLGHLLSDLLVALIDPRIRFH